MKNCHAYLILAHNNFNQLKKLIELLDDSRNDIYIHVDLKSSLDSENKKSIRAHAQKSRCYFVPRISVNWGGFSIVRAELMLLKIATRKGCYSYYHIISGADLPIKSQDYIHAFFDENQGKEFINFSDSYYTQKFSNRLKYYYFCQEFIGRSHTMLQTICRYYSRFLILIQKALKVDRIKAIDVASGSNWVSITHQFAKYIVDHEKTVFSFV